jgi:hypothetical protein
MWTGAKTKTVSPLHGEFVRLINTALLKTVDTFVMIKMTFTAVRCATGNLGGYRVFKDI